MSFANEAKSELLELPVRKSCCRRAYAAGLLFDADTDGGGRALASYSELAVAKAAQKAIAAVFGAEAVPCEPVGEGRGYALAILSPEAVKLISDMTDYGVDAIVGFSCEECAGCFLRGVFIASGSITSPERQYHLEVTVRNRGRADSLAELLAEYASSPTVSARKSGVGLIYKSSEKIEDLLSSIGAVKSYFAFLNGKITREIRNDANRYTNCMAGNIARIVSASRQQVRAIERLDRAGMTDKLPQELRETAQLRLLYPDISLSELGEKHCPPISRSGVHHRINKLMSMAEEIPAE